MTPSQIYPLPDLGVIRFSGPDALSFLQGQLTADLRTLQPGSSVLAAWCSPQGRIIALPRLLGSADALLAVLPRELIGPVLARLGRYVMRAKVVMEDVSERLPVAGLVATGPGAPVAADIDPAEQVVALPGQRALWIGGGGSGSGARSTWEQLAIEQGEPAVVAATSESWIPQMLNLDLLGAVSFTKGCYAGQEIVARTQHLGRIKRRMFRYRADSGAAVEPGSALLDAGAKVGEVVRSAAGSVLAVVNLDAAGRALTDESGTRYLPEPLPYPVGDAPSPG